MQDTGLLSRTESNCGLISNKKFLSNPTRNRTREKKTSQKTGNVYLHRMKDDKTTKRSKLRT